MIVPKIIAINIVNIDSSQRMQITAQKQWKLQ